jgi:hypothetical protein
VSKCKKSKILKIIRNRKEKKFCRKAVDSYSFMLVSHAPSTPGTAILLPQLPK